MSALTIILSTLIVISSSLIEITKWISNPDNSSLNLLFSGIVAISTVVYAVLTWKLVSETSKMREVQTEPNVYAFIEPRDEHNEITDMFIQNIGLGLARDIKFAVLSDFIYYKSERLSKIYQLSEIYLIKTGIEYIAPNQKMRIFSTSLNDVRELNSKNYLKMKIEYTNSVGKEYDSVYLIDFSSLPANGMSTGGAYKRDVLNSIKKIQGDMHEISSNIEELINFSKKEVVDSKDQSFEPDKVH
ncbi:hypothetical protein FXV91_14255 [Methanosarcina sp. DH2]|uniref:hypothetical protein n=1 Tax=Methanosarcina sp. DH2 TaxID=2605639 RepID=UPI001E635722|nr:hypothetical protein [Methanosarcina sp. DH2]MCC4771282.1 hypothetical protein [Methanosarcina sp. DH2]